MSLKKSHKMGLTHVQHGKRTFCSFMRCIVVIKLNGHVLCVVRIQKIENAAIFTPKLFSSALSVI